MELDRRSALRSLQGENAGIASAILELEAIALAILLRQLDRRLARKLLRRTLAREDEGYDYLELQTPRNAVSLDLTVRILEGLDLVRVEDERLYPWGLRRN
jgi:hypothetical protein